jgi:hypothetical protein
MISGVTNENNIRKFVEPAVRPGAARQRHPADQLVPGDRVLDVDVAAVHFQPRAVLAPSFGLVHQDEQLVTLDLVPAGRE